MAEVLLFTLKIYIEVSINIRLLYAIPLCGEYKQ